MHSALALPAHVASNVVGYFQSKPPMARLLGETVNERPNPKRAREGAARLLSNQYKLASAYPTYTLAYPLSWTENPAGHQNWEFNFHALRWLQPLLDDYSLNGSTPSLSRARDLVFSWIRANASRASASEMAWGDHSTAWRSVVLARFWEVFRRSELLDDEREIWLLLEAVQSHAEYLCEEYLPRSNHGLNQALGLLALAVTFFELGQSAQWRALAFCRFEQQMRDNFGASGMHLEQSPEYHVYTLSSLAAVLEFAVANDIVLPAAFRERLAQIYACTPLLLMPDGKTPMVGDSEPRWPMDAHNLRELGSLLDVPPFSDLAEWGQRLRSQPSSHYGDAGYYIARSGTWFDQGATDSFFLLFRTNGPSCPHAHFDALSFVLYRYDGVWFIDPGKYLYSKDDPYRKYFRSSEAHNTVT